MELPRFPVTKPSIFAHDCSNVKITRDMCDVPPKASRLESTYRHVEKTNVLGFRWNTRHRCCCNRRAAKLQQRTTRTKKSTQFRIPDENNLRGTRFRAFSRICLRRARPKDSSFFPSLSPFSSSPFLALSLSLARISLSIRRPADYYATATITFPRRHPLSWLFASLRSTRRNYLANPLKERKRRETWGRPWRDFSFHRPRKLLSIGSRLINVNK